MTAYLRFQRPIPNSPDRLIDAIQGWESVHEHVQCSVSEMLGGCVDIVDGCRVDLSAVIRPGCCEMSDNIRVIGHVDLDELGWRGLPVVIGDSEGDVVASTVMHIACRSG